MKISTELFQDDVRVLSEKAGIEKHSLLIQFLYHRANGVTNTKISDLIGVSRRTLQNWSNALDESLNVVERSELVAKAVVVEHDKRFGGDSE